MFQPSTSSFNPLTIPYLPDTYFPYSKRPLNHRPYNQEVDMKNPCVKRPRVGGSPIEHTQLAAMKKLERETLKKQSSNLCATHRTMIDMPIHVLKYLQSQGMNLNRTNEAMDLLSNQVADLTKKLETATKTFSQPTFVTPCPLRSTTFGRPGPLFSSTPKKNVPSMDNKKRKCPADDNDAQFEFDYSSRNQINMRKKLNSKRVSFFYERGDKMEMD